MDFYLDELRQAFYKISYNMLENLNNIEAKVVKLRKDILEENRKNTTIDELKLEKKRLDIQISVKTDKDHINIQNDWVEFLEKISASNQIDQVLAFVGQTNPKALNLDVKSLLESYESLCKFVNEEIISKKRIKDMDKLKPHSLGLIPKNQDREEYVLLTYRTPKCIRMGFNLKGTSDSKQLNEYEFIDNAMKAWNTLLDHNLEPTPNEYLMIHLAYRILKRSPGGTSLSQLSRYMGLPGFHPHTQTYMSLTDPGPGHLNGTVTKMNWMKKGVIVHLEHLERTTETHEKEPTRDEIESYRIPSLKWFLQTRLHVGEIAPQTLYIGRRLKDSDHFDNDL